MIAWLSSFCPPPGIKGLNDLNGPSAWGGEEDKTAITSILKQEWSGSGSSSGLHSVFEYLNS